MTPDQENWILIADAEVSKKDILSILKFDVAES